MAARRTRGARCRRRLGSTSTPGSRCRLSTTGSPASTVARPRAPRTGPWAPTTVEPSGSEPPPRGHSKPMSDDGSNSSRPISGRRRPLRRRAPSAPSPGSGRRDAPPRPGAPARSSRSASGPRWPWRRIRRFAWSSARPRRTGDGLLRPRPAQDEDVGLLQAQALVLRALREVGPDQLKGLRVVLLGDEVLDRGHGVPGTLSPDAAGVKCYADASTS